MMTLSKVYTFVIALSLLSLGLAEISPGAVRESYGRHHSEIFNRQADSHTKSPSQMLHLTRRRQNGKTNMAAVKGRHGKLAGRLNGHNEGHKGKGHNIHSHHGMNPHQCHELGFKNHTGLLRQIWMLPHPPRMDRKVRKTSQKEMRIRRSSPSKQPIEVNTGGIHLPQGITYTWTRDVGTGRTFNEAAFKSKDKNMVVVLSFDEALRDANLTASAALYDFTGTTAVMAIKPRARPGPCFLVDTSLTYEKILGDLAARNGSSVSTSSVIALDGTGNPVPLAERQAMLQKTPSLSRQCRGREIIRTRRTEFSPMSYDGQTKELKLLTMHAELSIMVPADLDLGAGPFGLWFQGDPKGSRRVKGQAHWKGQ